MSHALSMLNSLCALWMDTLLRASWQGGLRIALLWLLCRLWLGLPPVPRCWLWRLASTKLLLGLVWLPPLALPPLALPLLPHPPAAPPFTRTAALPEATPQAALADARRATVTVPALLVPAGPAPDHPARPQAPPSRPTLPTIQTWLMAAWLLGVLAGLGRVAAAWRRGHTLYRTSRPLTDETLQADAADLCRRFGLRRVPSLRAVDGLASPLLLGLGRPIVLLPAFALTDCARPEIRLMLAHELAHLTRRDLIWNCLPLVARLLFFFHPLVWLAGHEWGLAQEIACDAQAVQVTGTPPSAYGRMLLGIATRRRTPAAFPTLAVAGSRHTLRRRLSAMQHIRTISRSRLILAAALTALLALGGLPPWRVVAQPTPPPSVSPVAPQTEDAMLEKNRSDVASKNAQLDAQLAEIQKHLSPAQLKTVQSEIASINPEYAKEMQRVQLSEKSRAAYIATHPNHLTEAQIAFVQKVNWDKMHHSRISKSVQAKLAAIPADQRARVALMRSYSFEISGGRMEALIEKEVEISLLRARLAGKFPPKRQDRGAPNKASVAPPRHSAVSFGVEHRLYYFPKPGHRVRIFTQNANGQHLIMDKVSNGKVIIPTPVWVKEGDKIHFWEYDNSEKIVVRQPSPEDGS